MKNTLTPQQADLTSKIVLAENDLDRLNEVLQAASASLPTKSGMALVDFAFDDHRGDYLDNLPEYERQEFTHKYGELRRIAGLIKYIAKMEAKLASTKGRGF